MTRRDSLLIVIARALLAHPPTVEGMVQRVDHALGHSWRWIPTVAHRYASWSQGKTRPREREVVQFLRRDGELSRAWQKHRGKLQIAHWLSDDRRMLPAIAEQDWDLPPIESAAELARWLSIHPGELLWFADLKGLMSKVDSSPLQHYHYRLLRKRHGDFRVIEAPKPNLKDLQRRILSEILDKVPPHAAAFGFIKGRSIRDFAARHAGQQVVLKMDLSNFFPLISGPRVQALFRTLGYPESIADLLGGICTNATPSAIWSTLPPQVRRGLRDTYARPHLPQGAPTSPSLANACAYRLDCRLAGLAKAAGATYGRYADDLAFSGDHQFERHAKRFAIHVAVIAMEEGFVVNHRKTRVMRQGVRQRIAGLVVNQQINVARDDFDRLKATLTNCIRLGPESQNREAHAQFRLHLQGRVAFVESVNPQKGAKLRAIFEAITW